MRLLRLLLLAVFVSSGMVVTGGAGPAFACSCAYQQTLADEIFAGTLVSMADPPQRDVMSSTDPITYTVAVDAVYRGDVGIVAVFGSPMFGASCGLESMVVDRRYLFFVSTDGSDRTASLCGGTGPATPSRLDAVERLTGAPAQPAVAADGMAEATRVVARADGDDESVQAALSKWTTGVAGLIGASALIGAAFKLHHHAASRRGRQH